jgi:Tfp pilus assembly protein PilZ
LEGSFFIIIKPPNRQTMSVAGKVIWSTIIQPSGGDSSLGVGVQFTDMTPGDRKFLSQTVARHYRKKLSRMNNNKLGI